MHHFMCDTVQHAGSTKKKKLHLIHTIPTEMLGHGAREKKNAWEKGMWRAQAHSIQVWAAEHRTQSLWMKTLNKDFIHSLSFSDRLGG